MFAYLYGYFIVFFCLQLAHSINAESKKPANEPLKLLVVTVATDAENDGLRRLKASTDEFGLKLLILGTNEKWNGGDMQNGVGGAQKIRILREALVDYKTGRDNLLIMFVDAYDVIFNADERTIVSRFLEHFAHDGNRVVFGAEPFCWPDRTLASKYPLVTFGERFLNSGMFLGYVSDVYEMLERGKNLKDNDDDQLFYTRLYIDEKSRNALKIGLDALSRIFQNLNGMIENVAIEFSDVDGNAEIYNRLYHTHPVVIHGNGPSKIDLNSFGNYIAHRYNRDEECVYCKKLIAQMDTLIDKYPILALAIFVTKPIPYVEEFLELLEQLDYPKDRVHLFLYNNQRYNNEMMENYVKTHGKFYASVEILDKTGVGEHSIRDLVIRRAKELSVDYLFMLDADVHLSNTQALKTLTRMASAGEIGILAPMVTQPGKLFSNFWGAVSSSGYYARSADYMSIAERERRGVWNVPFVNGALLIARVKLQRDDFLSGAFAYVSTVDADMSFAHFCRDKGHFMFVTNLDEFGYLVESEAFANLPEHHIHRELYDFPNNKLLWQKRYIHDGYFAMIEPNTEVPLACPDVYDFPLVSERFCREMIDIMENYGKWSDGTNFDKRLDGGYENVPTRDIHMNQVGFDAQWLAIMDAYVAPLQEKLFIGYYQRPVKANMMFVVRYRPDEQPSLRPHQDASTYSIDIALNRRGVDYEGGGVRYLRYNCTVRADQIGWSIMFPGRLTHMHEGLPTTNGTRYILVSFINP